MSYFHNKFNKVDRVGIYQFIKYLEDIEENPACFNLGWEFQDEFRKLRQIVAFAYSHGFKDDNV